jgi:CheY-specific phosphatase CheX
MQAIDLQPFMEEAVAEVLEAMCFISSEGEVKEGAEMCQWDWICGELDFVGCVSGSFGIAVPPSIAATIAANFLGEDESTLSAEQTMEVICELTNMVCGTLLSRMDSKSVFTLSSPRSSRCEERNFVSGRKNYCTYSLDEGFISTWLDNRVCV